MCRENFGVPAWIVGVVVAILTAIVIFGGIKAIANVCEKLVPFMAIFYALGCVIILCMNYDYIIPALATICKLAFTPGAVAGGLVGTGIRYAIQYGVARDCSLTNPVLVLPDRSSGSTDKKSGSSGISIFYWYILGYSSCMCIDRSCSCNNNYEESYN